MEERKMTTSAVVSFAERLEKESSKFYKKLTIMAKQDKEFFIAFAEEGRRNSGLIVRTYQETISDALEACFSFEGLNPNEYLIDTAILQDTDYLRALEMALDLEACACKFYTDLVECSASLLATIPRVFKRVAETRKNRIPKLKAIIDQLRAT